VAQKAAITRNQRENTNFKAPANQKPQIEELLASLWPEDQSSLKPGENRPVTSNQTQKRTCSAAGFLPEPYIDHAVLGCVTHRISCRIPARIQHSYRPAARVFTSSGPRDAQDAVKATDSRPEGLNPQPHGCVPLDTPHAVVLGTIDFLAQLSPLPVSTTCLHYLSPQPVSTAQQPCWLGELWPMSAKHGSTKFLGKKESA